MAEKIDFNIQMMKLKPVDEAIDTRIGVSCTQSMKERYGTLRDRLLKLKPDQRKVLTKAARDALEEVLTQVEAFADEFEAKAKAEAKGA